MMKNKKGLIPIILGILLLSAAVVLAVYNISTEKNAEKNSHNALSGILNSIPEIKKAEEYKYSIITDDTPNYVINPDIQMPQISVDGTEYIATISIPTLNIELPVCKEYSEVNLKNAPCRYYGSIYTDDFIICAHNYKKHFKYLDSLKVGDSVYLVDMDGNMFSYRLTELVTLDPDNVSAFYDGEWDLTLFTCTKSGAKRIVARFEKDYNF